MRNPPNPWPTEQSKPVQPSANRWRILILASLGVLLLLTIGGVGIYLAQSHSSTTQTIVAPTNGLAAATTATAAGTGATPIGMSTNTPVPAMTYPTSTPYIDHCTSSASQLSGVQRFGDLYLSTTSPVLANFIAYQLPDGTPLKPIALPAQYKTIWYNPTNPNPSAYMSLCDNQSGQSHTIQTMSLRIISFTPYSGQLNEWQACASVFDPQYGTFPTINNCGGYGFQQDLHVTFPKTITSGTTISMTSDPASVPNALPVKVYPDQSLLFIVHFDNQPTPGYYQFAYSVTVDGKASPFYMIPTMLVAQVSHEWSGQACTNASLRSQIPANSTEQYICPQS